MLISTKPNSCTQICEMCTTGYKYIWLIRYQSKNVEAKQYEPKHMTQINHHVAQKSCLTNINQSISRMHKVNMMHENSSTQRTKTISLTPPKSNILSLSPFGIKCQKSKSPQAGVERRSHGVQPQTNLQPHQCHHLSSLKQLPDPQNVHEQVKRSRSAQALWLSNGLSLSQPESQLLQKQLTLTLQLSLMSLAWQMTV